MNAIKETQRICALLENGESDRTTFLDSCTRLIAGAVGCSRAGVWIFADRAQGRTLRCLAMYDGLRNRMTTVADQPGDHVGVYFQILEQVGYVMATDARTHFATADLFTEHLMPNGIESILTVSLSVNGKQYGAFTCTQVGEQMEWGRSQLNLVRQIGSRVSLAMATQIFDAAPSPIAL
jgi:GAF domain-containing protein